MAKPTTAARAPVSLEIIDASEIQSLTSERRGKRDLRVTYTAAGARTYMLDMPAEDVTNPDGTLKPERVIERIKAAELERLKVVGQTFEV